MLAPGGSLKSAGGPRVLPRLSFALLAALCEVSPTNGRRGTVAVDP